MRVEEEDDQDDNRDGDTLAIVTTEARFSCNDLEPSSEESGDELDSSTTPYHLLEKRSPEEKSVLLALGRVHRLKIQEEVRSKLSSLDIQSEIQRTISVSARIEKYAESRKELVLDEHLSMVQSDHEQRSQIVERGIRDDAAVEEARRREQSMKEEEIK
ncbi:hypothetical protein QYE76_000702 [Lolium multiflorum]|uniref:Uncharacterized protein n=1 Tax=Lolium multiflorum TaxID=4521 RepID=A0AAD8VWM6_LOLMU|nr:hypothetical protein QYE76_000702 [Lolium multiflorum]